jgi:hypothetical protein
MTHQPKRILLIAALTMILSACSASATVSPPTGPIVCRMESQRRPATLGNGIAIAYSDHVEIQLLPAPGADPLPVFQTSEDIETRTRTNQYAVLDTGEYTIEVINPETGDVIETEQVNIKEHQYATIGIACTGGPTP